MLARCWLVVLLLCSLVSLSPLAFAFPPDSLWIPGIYDEEDGDNAVELAASIYQGVASPWVDLVPSVIALERCLPRDLTTVVGANLLSSHSRAPPTV